MGVTNIKPTDIQAGLAADLAKVGQLQTSAP
jgi:hypothetical protein